MVELDKRDRRLLDRLDVDVAHKAYLEELWRENAPLRLTWSIRVGEFLVRLVVPVICAVLTVRLLMPGISLDSLLRLVWSCVFTVALGLPLFRSVELLLLIIGAKKSDTLRTIFASPSTRRIVEYVARRTLWGRVVIWQNILLVLLLIMIDWNLTAMFFFVGWIGFLVLGQLGKGMVKEAIADLYKYHCQRVAEAIAHAKNITPRSGGMPYAF